jgi:hypothetical protein
VAHEFGRARKLRTGNRKVGNGTQEEDKEDKEDRGKRGRAVFMVVEKSSTATVHAPSPIGRALNPRGATHMRTHHDPDYI